MFSQALGVILFCCSCIGSVPVWSPKLLGLAGVQFVVLQIVYLEVVCDDQLLATLG